MAIFNSYVSLREGNDNRYFPIALQAASGWVRLHGRGQRHGPHRGCAGARRPAAGGAGAAQHPGLDIQAGDVASCGICEWVLWESKGKHGKTHNIWWFRTEAHFPCKHGCFGSYHIFRYTQVGKSQLMEQPQARVIRWYGLQTAYTTYWVKSTSEIGWFWNSKAGTLLTKRVPEWLGQYSVSCWLHCRKVSWRLLSMIFFDHILPILPYILIIYIYYYY